MTTLAIKKRIRMIEVPINYIQRVGESKITGNFYNSTKVGLGIIFSLFKHRLIK